MRAQQQPAPDPGRAGRRAVWVAALLVATGAGVATAHGLFEVAAGAGVPVVVAWLYPLITDGLALVAYAATARLRETSRRYAAGIVIAAAGLSGLAQAVYLAGALQSTGPAPVGLRFGVGAWPAVAAALTAHLLHLIGTGDREVADRHPADDDRSGELPDRRYGSSYSEPYARTAVPSYNPLYNAPSNPAVQPRTTTDEPKAVQPPAAEALNTRPEPQPTSGVLGGGSARTRARASALSHRQSHGAWPTVTELMSLADVARGTAGTALKALRKERPALHVVNAETENTSQNGSKQ
jgi:hypothetical protein